MFIVSIVTAFLITLLNCYRHCRVMFILRYLHCLGFHRLEFEPEGRWMHFQNFTHFRNLFLHRNVESCSPFYDNKISLLFIKVTR